MTAEIIIAVRGESESNLKRTIGNIRKTSSAKICLVMDGAEQPNYGEIGVDRIERPWSMPRGCGQARHYGIETSKAPIVIITDGHMQYPVGWADEVVGHLEKHPKDVTCCQMRHLNPDWSPETVGTPYSGAHIELFNREPCGGAVWHWPIAAKWNKEFTRQGQISAPMGACYGMTRKHYAAMGKPLGILEDWGGDEELLAICGWLCGGRTWLLPIECGHVHGHDGMFKRTVSRTQEVDRIVNRGALADMLGESGRELLDFFFATWPADERAEQLWRQRKPRVDALAARLARQRRKWSDFVGAGWAITAENKEARQMQTPQVIHRTHDKCEACGAVGRIKQTSGMRDKGAFLQASAKCTRCGNRVQIRRGK